MGRAHTGCTAQKPAERQEIAPSQWTPPKTVRLTRAVSIVSIPR
jgi:hypothetical protein